MENLYLLPTDKPSRLFIDNDDKKLRLGKEAIITEYALNQHIYITSDEKIKEGDWVYYLHNSGLHKPSIHKVVKPNYSDYKPYSIHFTSGFGVQEDCKKIILTTDQDLVKDGVQAIDDEFLEWFVKNPSCEEIEIKLVEQRSHLSSNDWVDSDENGKFPISIAGAFCYRKIHKIIIPKEEPKERLSKILGVKYPVKHKRTVLTTEEVMKGRSSACDFNDIVSDNFWELIDMKAESDNIIDLDAYGKGVRDGVKWQQERSYSEKDLLSFGTFIRIEDRKEKRLFLIQDYYKKWLEQFKKK